MSKEEIIDRIIRILEKVFEESQFIDGGSLVSELEIGSLNEVFNITSVKAIEAIVVIENEFNIEIDDSELSMNFFRSLDYISEYVKSKIT
jgi:acyl carrier protein